MKQLKYCIQCVDKTTNEKGDFLHYDDFIAVSPIYNNLIDLLNYMRSINLTTEKSLSSFNVIQYEAR